MKLEIEEVIGHLTASPRRIPIAQIRGALGLELSPFQSWRRSTDTARKQQLAERIIAAFPEHFPEGKMSGILQTSKENAASSEDIIYEKYIASLERNIAMLEQNLKRTEGERDKLREETESAMSEIKKERDDLRNEVKELIERLKKEVPET